MTSHDLEAPEREINNENGHFTPAVDSRGTLGKVVPARMAPRSSGVEIRYTVIAPPQNPWETLASTQRVKSVRIALTFSRRGMMNKAITRSY